MSTRLHLLTERLSSLFRASLRETASRHELKLVQIEALIYLSMANRYSDTPAALTQYLGLTKGTVSQTLKVLEQRGLITKLVDPNDARSKRCGLTKTGQAIVKEAFPARCFASAEAAVQDRTAEQLEELLRTLQGQNEFRTFGLCRTCRFFQPKAKGGGTCGLTQESLSKKDSTLICREHELVTIGTA